MKTVIIFGMGAMAKTLYSFLKGNKFGNIEFCADDQYVKSEYHLGRSLIKYSQLDSMPSPIPIEVVMGLGYHEMNRVRMERFYDLMAKGYDIGGYISPDLVIHDGVWFNKGVVIYDKVSIHPYSTIGDNVFISSNVNIGHDCTIQEGVWINSGVAIGGGTKIGKRCVLSMNCTIGHGVKLGDETFVGAGAVVTKDTQPGSVIFGGGTSTGLDIDSQRFLKLTRLI